MRQHDHGAGSRRRMAAVMVGMIAVAACSERPDTTAPARAESGVNVAALPAPLAAYLNALPVEVKPVWQACRDSGTFRPAGTPLVTGTNCRLMDVDGYPRRYVVYVPNHPAIAAPTGAPLVMMFHGTGQHGERFYSESGWRGEADTRGFIVAFPTGVQYQVVGSTKQFKWNNYGLLADVDTTWRPSGYPATAPWPANDVSFASRMLDDIVANATIDTTRVHASGFSNGGGFVSRLAIEIPHRLASVAAITTPLPSVYTPPIPIPFFFGTGAIDDGILAGLNASLPAGHAPLTRLPMNPDSLFMHTGMRQRRDSMAATFGLVATTFATTRDSVWTLMRWHTRISGNQDGNVAWWGIIAGVTHEYPRGHGRFLPNGVALATNNPRFAFDAPRTFYNFFQAHPK